MVALAGCSPTPEPAPEPTSGFASEEEAFAAAEETYRAYVEALNHVDLSDPETFEDVYAWTTGEANAEIRTSLSKMHADSLTVSGRSVAAVVRPGSITGAARPTVELLVCLDVSSVGLVDPTGESVVSPERPDTQSLTVTLVPSESTDTQVAIESIRGRDGAPKCD